MTHAVIKTGGKQYLVTPGQQLMIEKIEGEKGAHIAFDSVLLVADDKNIQLGLPMISGAKVDAEVVEQGKAKKITVFKYHSKTRTRKKKGHQQLFTKVAIKKITS